MNAKRKACLHPMCGTVHTEAGQYCAEHMDKHKVVDTRPSAAARGYDAKWAAAKKAYLKKNRYCVCPECREGDPERANTVDHILPHRGDMRLFWDVSNWQAMYKPHHDRKTAEVDGGFGR